MLYQIYLPLHRQNRHNNGPFLGYLSLCQSVEWLRVEQVWERLLDAHLIQGELPRNHFMQLDFNGNGTQASIGRIDGNDWRLILKPLKSISDSNELEDLYNLIQKNVLNTISITENWRTPVTTGTNYTINVPMDVFDRYQNYYGAATGPTGPNRRNE